MPAGIERQTFRETGFPLEEDLPNGLKWNGNTGLAVTKDLSFQETGRITDYNTDNQDVILPRKSTVNTVWNARWNGSERIRLRCPVNLTNSSQI